MIWEFLALVCIGPVIGFFVYYLLDDRKRTEEYLDQLRAGSRLA